MTEALKGQMSIYDIFPRDTWSGKTYPAPSVPEPRKAKTSESSLKKSQGSAKKMPLYLDLRKKDGILPDASWETGGALLGEYMMHSFGESPKDAVESRLSQILEENPLQKYCLSARACQGILSRAERRGKELPEILRKALENQSNGTTDVSDPKN